MLVLSRKQKQRIRINDEIIITIVQVKGNTVKVGIEADKDKYRVVRDELPTSKAA